ncbi:MAG: hypothetical protein FD123_1495 [Bacteroidetes bacterium]|nr:MAG: hypothetical protein FD123_1495 [Bacteroidota bacterium]
MRKRFIIPVVFFLGIFAWSNFCSPETAQSWGFYGHKRINRMAVFTLPPDMIGFYKKHIDFVTEHAVDPDKRRYGNPDEAPRHYIDIDHYGKKALDSMPRYWKQAVTKYTEDTLMAYGIVPWHIDKMLYRLTEAFKEGNIDKILHYSADIGHYIGDAHVPLHTTENYNGQLTGQHGIHGFWESRVPELEAENYDYWTGRARYVDKPQLKAWDFVKASHLAVDSVLNFEKELTKTFPSDRKYAFENRGSSTIKTYSEDFSLQYSKMLNGMVERRMRHGLGQRRAARSHTDRKQRSKRLAEKSNGAGRVFVEERESEKSQRS